MGILDRVDLDQVPPTLRWTCRDCGRNGMTMNATDARRREDECPDCGGTMDLWPSTESLGPTKDPNVGAVPDALRFLTDGPSSDPL